MSDDTQRESGVGLALPGGGIRATLFHPGRLWRLNEPGHLRRRNVITGVSGRSIVSGVLTNRWKNLVFDGNGVAANFPKGVARSLRDFCARSIDVPAGTIGKLPGVGGGGVVTLSYRRHLFGDAMLQYLPSGTGTPHFLFCATSLQTRGPASEFPL